MKVRIGFVSNSSSSSFIMLGKSVGSLQQRTVLDFTKPNSDYIMIGKDLCDGIDLIDLNEDLYHWFIEHRDDILENSYIDGTIYEVYKSGEYLLRLNKRDLPDGDFDVFSIEFDHHSTETIDDAHERYL